MRTLHLFNPSHDEALAANSAYYYPSKIAQRLRHDWALLPTLWAQPGDAVWVDDESASHCPWRSDVTCVKTREMKTEFWKEIDRIAPWGWDALVRQQLRKAGAPVRLLPTDEELQQMRQLSSRHTTALLLPLLRKKLSTMGIDTVGESQIVGNEAEVRKFASEHPRIMAKALWSCSGRGVFPLTAQPSESEQGRVRRLLHEQGGLELEPFYEGRLNFALEFDLKAEGGAAYAGLSLFSTSTTGNYLGNRVAPPSVLEQSLLAYGLDLPCVIQACTDALNETLAGKYAGPLGIDMMLVAHADKVVLHPCIEVNLRLTMGRVAVALQQRGCTEIPTPFQSLFQLA